MICFYDWEECVTLCGDTAADPDAIVIEVEHAQDVTCPACREALVALGVAL